MTTAGIEQIGYQMTGGLDPFADWDQGGLQGDSLAVKRRHSTLRVCGPAPAS
jgi:hypothetical protein